jgi:hypothetical protein
MMDPEPLKTCTFKTVATIYPTMHRHITEDWDWLLHRCANLESHNSVFSFNPLSSTWACNLFMAKGHTHYCGLVCCPRVKVVNISDHL